MRETDIFVNDLHGQEFKKRQNFLFIIVRDIHGGTAAQHILDMKIIVALDDGNTKPNNCFYHFAQIIMLQGVKHIPQMDKTAGRIAVLQPADAFLHGRKIVM